MSEALNGRSRSRARRWLQPPEATADRPHIDDLAAPYALGALEPEDVGRIERHCRVCRSCAQLVADTSRTVAFLPFVAPLVVPSPDVKAALFARIVQIERASAVGQAPPRPQPAVPTLTIPASRIPSCEPAAIGVEPGTPESKGQWPGSLTVGARGLVLSGRMLNWPIAATPYIAAPLILALVIVSGWAVWLQEEGADHRAQVRTLQEQVSTLDRRLANNNSFGGYDEAMVLPAAQVANGGALDLTGAYADVGENFLGAGPDDTGVGEGIQSLTSAGIRADASDATDADADIG